VLSGLLLAGSATACLKVAPVDPSVLGGLAESTSVRAADGSLLTTLHSEQDRRPLELAKIPKLLRDAVVAIEDRRFYSHSGVDLKGVVRAAVRDVERGGTAQGGSTITQQLVKNTIVTRERSLQRKVREAALALGLERTLTKDQILERYLNTVYFGEGAYGVGAAIRTYFGHGPSRVSLPEAALLAGLIQSPSRADPIRDAAAAKARRHQVLNAMVSTGVVTRERALAADRAAVPHKVHRDDVRYPAAYAVQDAVANLLDDPRLGATPELRRDLLFRGGLTVTLTIDRAQQTAAEQALASTLNAPHDPTAGIAAVRPGDGAITAMVGGRDFFATKDKTAKLNLARGGSTKRQAGSTFKVFTLLAALEAGIQPDDLFEAGAEVSLPRRYGAAWHVRNYEGSAFGQITLRQATEHSVNTAYARVVQQIGRGDVDLGAARVVEVAERLGVRGAHEKKLRVMPATTLGSQEVDPVEMAAAYATLASGGVYARPYLVARVTGPDGDVLIDNAPALRRALPGDVAAIANDVLAGVVRNGTGVRAQLARPMAGKTGTSTGYRDAWFVGYTPNFAAAVWVGIPTGQVSMTPENGFRTVVAGGTFPAIIWQRFANIATRDLPAASFPTQQGASVTLAVDVVRGCLPNQFTPPSHIADRTFPRGAQPRAVCQFPAGPPATEVVDVRGLDKTLATARLVDLGFAVKWLPVYAPGTPDDLVVRTNPAVGATVDAGATITLEVSGADPVYVAVPNLLGMDVATARKTLKGIGLRLDVAEEAPCASGTTCAEQLARASGHVWRQDLQTGTTVLAGTSIPVRVGPTVTLATTSPTPTPTATSAKPTPSAPTATGSRSPAASATPSTTPTH
jgi:penicillin-binding protein 1A